MALALAVATALVLALPAAAQAPPGDGGSGGVAAFAGEDGPRCGPIDHGGRLTRGGCPATLYSSDALLRIRMGMGSFEFGACTTTFTLNIDGRGRFWMDRLGIGGASPCNDVRPCAPHALISKFDGPGDAAPLDRVIPWPGRIVRAEAGGRFTGWMDVCFDTCIGRYEGRIPVTLLRAEGSWRMRTGRAGVGASGLEIDADWKVNDEALLELRPAE